MIKQYSYEDWCRYVKNEIGDTIRNDMEAHLYSCDQCLDIYLEVLDCEGSGLPNIQNEHYFTDSVLTGIADLKKQTAQVEGKKSFSQSSVFHYLIAAAMTMVLMLSGVFQSIIKYTDTVQSPQSFQKSTSFSEGIIHKTFTWMDTFELKNKEVKK
jgi:hypothetical protein